MRLNFAYPATGLQKSFEVDEEKKLRVFFEKRMSQEVAIDSLGDEWKVSEPLKTQKRSDVSVSHPHCFTCFFLTEMAVEIH